MRAFFYAQRKPPSFVPPGWSTQPVEGRRDVIRYVSPDRQAVLTLRDIPARAERVWKRVFEHRAALVWWLPVAGSRGCFPQPDRGRPAARGCVKTETAGAAVPKNRKNRGRYHSMTRSLGNVRPIQPAVCCTSSDDPTAARRINEAQASPKRTASSMLSNDTVHVTEFADTFKSTSLIAV
jgi:hypothetical protein